MKVSILTLILIVAAGALSGAEEGTGTAPAGAWKPLFNGKDLGGWRLYGKADPPGPGWKVEDGILKKLQGIRGGDIITEQKFNDFELSWEWRISPGGNNGVKYFVQEERPSAPGPEYQMIDERGYAGGKLGATHQTAAFYDVLPPSKEKEKRLKPAGQWNTSRIVVRGPRVEHWLNGAPVLSFEFGSEAVKQGLAKSKFKSAPGFGDKIQGHIMLTDHRDECWFRNIKIRELK